MFAFDPQLNSIARDFEGNLPMKRRDDGVDVNGKTPGFYFYPADYERDVQSLSLAAQGLWTRMLCWMHFSKHRGYLKFQTEIVMTPSDIASRVGKPLKEVRNCLAEMERIGLYNKDASGCIYSRRMANDTHISEVRRKAAEARLLGAERTFAGTFAPAKQPMCPANDPANAKQNTVLSSSSSSSTSKTHTEVIHGSRSAAPQQPESARASSQESKTPDEDAMRWLEFRQLAEQRAIKGTSVDWNAAFDKWEQLSVDERIKAFRGLAVRPLSSDQELRYRTNVTKYFERKLWEEAETTPALTPIAGSSGSAIYRPWKPSHALADQQQSVDKKIPAGTDSPRPKLMSRNGTNGN